MRKKIGSILLIFVCFLIIDTVRADYTCQYHWDRYLNKETTTNYYVSFNVDDGEAKRANSNTNAETEPIMNWDDDECGFDASEYAEYELCPPYLMVFEEDGAAGNYHFYVADKNSYKKVKEWYDEEKGIDTDGSEQNYLFMELTKGPVKWNYDFDDEFTFTYYINNEYAQDPNQSYTWNSYP